MLIEPWLAIKREVYLCVTVDPAAQGYVVLYVPCGGVDIENGKPPLAQLDDGSLIAADAKKRTR